MIVNYLCPNCGHKISFNTGNGTTKPSKTKQKKTILDPVFKKKITGFFGKIMTIIVWAMALFVIYLVIEAGGK